MSPVWATKRDPQKRRQDRSGGQTTRESESLTKVLDSILLPVMFWSCSIPYLQASVFFLGEVGIAQVTQLLYSPKSPISCTQSVILIQSEIKRSLWGLGRLPDKIQLQQQEVIESHFFKKLVKLQVIFTLCFGIFHK